MLRDDRGTDEVAHGSKLHVAGRGDVALEIELNPHQRRAPQKASQVFARSGEPPVVLNRDHHHFFTAVTGDELRTFTAGATGDLTEFVFGVLQRPARGHNYLYY